MSRCRGPVSRVSIEARAQRKRTGVKLRERHTLRYMYMFKTEGSVQSCREYVLETGSKLREGGGRGRGVLIEKSEAIAQPQSGGRLMLLNLT